MDIEDFPPNSDTSKREPKVEERKIRRVTSEEPVRRKKSLRKQFAEVFIAGDAKTAARNVIFEVMVPAAKEMIMESGEGWLRSYFMGETRRRGGSLPPQTGPYGHIDYRGRFSMSRQSGPQRVLSREARARHDFDEIVLQERVEAEEVVDLLMEAVSQYGQVSVADLYAMVGLSSTHVDTKWGWTELRGAGVSRVRGGYLLDLPAPHKSGPVTEILCVELCLFGI